MNRQLLRIGVGLALVVALAAAYTFWFRDSSLVAVDQVKVEGVGNDVAEGEAIRQALVAAGRQMTTLNVDLPSLRQAVADYPEVADVEADTGFPDSLTVRVVLRRPVARIGEGSDAVGVAADGVVLPAAVIADLVLPSLPLSEPPDSDRVGGPVLTQVRVLAAAPEEMLAVTDSIARSDDYGPIVTLTSGIELRFGDSSRLAEKWQAAVAVLNDPELELLDYVDLSSPGRPAVGGAGHSLPTVP